MEVQDADTAWEPPTVEDELKEPLKNRIIEAIVKWLAAFMLATAVVSFVIISVGLPSALGAMEVTMVSIEKDFVKNMAQDKAVYISEYLRGVKNDVELIQQIAKQAVADAPLSASSKYNVPFPHSSLPDNIHYQSAWVDKFNVNHYKHPSVYNVRAFNTDWPKGYETDENVHLAGVMKAGIATIASKSNYISAYIGIMPESDDKNPIYVTSPYRNAQVFRLYGGSGGALCHGTVALHGGRLVKSCGGYGQQAFGDAATCGYDPRCRPWFNDAISNQIPKESVVFSAPYEDASTGNTVQTASAAVYAPDGTTLKGVVAIDFAVTEIDKSVSNTRIMDNGYAMLVSTGAKMNVAAMHKDEGWNLGSIYSLVDTSRRYRTSEGLRTIAAEMRKGCSGFAQYVDGTDGKTWVVGYEPINTTFSGISKCETSTASDFAYSVAILVPESDILKAFSDIRQTTITAVSIALVVTLVAILASVGVVSHLAFTMAHIIVDPIKELLDLVIKINKRKFEADMEEKVHAADAGSPELRKLAEAFTKMATVVKFANQSLEGGNLSEALSNYEHALTLFQSLNNKRGISICQNNMANVYNLMDNPEQAEPLYQKAIDCSQEALDALGSSTSKEDIEQRDKISVQMFDRLMNYSALLRKAGRTTRASTLLTKALGLLGNCENIDKGTHIALINRIIATYAEAFRDAEGEGKRVPFVCTMVLGRVRNLLSKGLEILDTMLKHKTREDQTPASVQLQRLLLDSGTLYDYMLKIPESEGGFDDPKTIEEVKEERMRCYAGGVCVGPQAILRKSVQPAHALQKILEDSGDHKGVEWIKNIIETLEIAGAVVQTKDKHQQRARHFMFVLDYSGSMAGGRIKRAVRNMLVVYDEHVTDKDTVSFIRFSRKVDIVRCWEPKSSSFRTALEKSTNPRGSTAFYDAAIAGVNLSDWDQSKASQHGWKNKDFPKETFLVTLSDGDDTASSANMAEAAAKLSKDANCTMICVGLMLSDDANAKLDKLCKDSGGMFLPAASNEELDDVFVKVVQFIDDLGLKMETY